MTDEWSIGEAIEYLEDAAPEDAQASAFSGGAIEVVWSGRNRIEVFKSLAQHGWVMTSIDDADSSEHATAYLEQAASGVEF